MPNVDTPPVADDDSVPAIAYKPRRRTGKAASGTTRTKPAPAKRPVKLVVDEGVYEAMVVHGLRRGETLSELISNLVKTHLTDYVIHHRPSPRS